jgi:glycosyltransferase involved in cell wall biosynthesis
MPKVSIIIPARNEEKGIGATLGAIPYSEFKNMGYAVEVIVIDNCSQDKTAEIAKQMNAIVIYKKKRGYGRAYKAGFLHATGDVIITSDADGTYPVKEAHKLLQLFLQNSCDFMTTNRFGYSVNGAMSFRNQLGNKILSIVMGILYGINISDSQSGMWIFKRELLDDLELRYNDWVFSQEIKIESCYYVKAKWMEVPIHYYKRFGNTNGGSWKVGLFDLYHLLVKRLVR